MSLSPFSTLVILSVASQAVAQDCDNKGCALHTMLIVGKGITIIQNFILGPMTNEPSANSAVACFEIILFSSFQISTECKSTAQCCALLPPPLPTSLTRWSAPATGSVSAGVPSTLSARSDYTPFLYLFLLRMILCVLIHYSLENLDLSNIRRGLKYCMQLIS